MVRTSSESITNNVGQLSDGFRTSTNSNEATGLSHSPPNLALETKRRAADLNGRSARLDMISDCMASEPGSSHVGARIRNGQRAVRNGAFVTEQTLLAHSNLSAA